MKSDEIQNSNSESRLHPMSKEFELLYGRLCKYSDYLDELQRSSQRYYFVALGGSLGILATVYNAMVGKVQGDPLELIISLSEWIALPLLGFGVLTIVQLASLRALNFRTDRRLEAMENELGKKTPLPNLFLKSQEDERTKFWKFGNDWAKAAFVALGNGLAVIAYHRRFGSCHMTVLFIAIVLFSITAWLVISHRRIFRPIVIQSDSDAQDNNPASVSKK